jgi:hypothetical protein
LAAYVAGAGPACPAIANEKSFAVTSIVWIELAGVVFEPAAAVVVVVFDELLDELPHALNPTSASRATATPAHTRTLVVILPLPTSPPSRLLSAPCHRSSADITNRVVL